MTNRRQFLGLGIAAAVWPGLAGAAQRVSTPGAPAEEPASLPLYKAIYDEAYAPALAFAAQMRRRGVAVHAIDQDVTSVWFHDLALRWRRDPVAIAGLTAPAALFCLEQLAWDHRMRVVFRATHRRGPDGAIEHEIRAPQSLRPHIQASFQHTARWEASMADLAIHCPSRALAALELTMSTRARAGEAGGLPLVSWVIAPVKRV